MITKEQEKAMKSLERALKKCSDANVGIMVEDDAIYYCNNLDLYDNGGDGWQFLRDYNDNDGLVDVINSYSVIKSTGGA